MQSDMIESDLNGIVIEQSVYRAGNDVTIKYRTAENAGACYLASWTTYNGGFVNLGVFQIRLEV